MMRFFFLLFVMGVIGHVLWYSWHYGITPTPTSAKVKKSILDVLPSLKPEQKILELGSGWGMFALALAHHYPECVVYAYEISPVPFYFSKMFSILKKRGNIHFERKDFFSVSFEDASLIFCYLYPAAMNQLREKFEKEIHPGTYVITHTFAISGWVPFQIIFADDIYKTPIYIYEF
jgi:16S rRNA A1518/A1519 N6-dimethyltransferase RsmA/KsgA/DIM1 with predicted DNA glycosylase/AP lyase activity